LEQIVPAMVIFSDKKKDVRMIEEGTNYITVQYGTVPTHFKNNG